jgi:hypothetical protein
MPNLHWGMGVLDLLPMQDVVALERYGMPLARVQLSSDLLIFRKDNHAARGRRSWADDH